MLTDQLKQFMVKTLPGMNNLVEDLDLKDKWVKKAQNCRFEEEPGAVDKRDPVTYFNTSTMGSGAVVGLTRFYTSSGVTKFISVHGTKAKVGSDAAGTFTDIRTGLTDGKRISFEVYKDLLIASNGYDNIWVYDGSSDNITWELGSCKAKLSANTGTVLEDCEDAWDEQVVADVTASSDTGDKQVGSASAKFVVDAAAGTGVMASEVISSTDLSDIKYIHAWVKSSVDLDAGDWQILVDEHADCASPTALDIPALTADTWTRVAIVASSLTEAAVISIGLNQAVDKGAMSFWIDDVRTSQLGVGDYYYAVTIDADAYVCGAVSNTVTTTASYTQVSLSNIPLGPVGTTNRKLYRTEADGSSLKLLATIADNTTTEYTDNISDASLGAGLPSVTDDMPKGSILKIHRERLFISGDPSNPNKIYYSNPYLSHYIQQTANLDYMEISPEDNDEIMGIPLQLGVMVCVKKNTLRRLHITSPTSGADPTSWYADDPISFIGSPAQWSITQTSYGIIFLGWDHWYLFDGAQAKPIMDEFDVQEILPANYSDTVGFMHNGIFLAAYTDNTLAAQFHNRIMRYNFKRKSLGYDLWTSSTVSGANCFAAKTGDDETGELYYGDSQNGYIVKEKTSEDTYRLKTKTECNEGSGSDIFVGGTENSPYLEIGASSAADAIPDDVCIFWDDPDTTPGASWTEISSDGSYLLINSTTGTEAAGSGHTHTMTGSSGSGGTSVQNSGDGNANCTRGSHTHTVSATSNASSAVGPRYIKLRVFKASSNSDTEFPDGSIVMWDQPTAPTGWQVLTAAVGNSDGYYIKMGTTDLNEANSSTHSHSYSGTTGACPLGNHESDGGTDCSRVNHTHTFSGTTNASAQDTWEVAYAAFRFIKKIGESDTWDGSSKYVYCLYDGAGTPGADWTDMTSTYTGKYIKIGADTPTTGDAANAAHTHTASGVTSATEGQTWGNAGYHAQASSHHTHPITWGTSGSTDSSAPPSRTYRIFKKLLGKMKDFNGAIESKYTSGTWTSPSQQIDAESLNKIYWNESITAPSTDNILIHTRTGASKTACEAASWSSALSDPNGSDIASTADAWLQYKVEFTADDTMNDNPKVYFTNAFVIKYTYEKGATNAETSVNQLYEFGFRNFNTPMQDKFFKKIGTVHEGAQGSFTFTWETEDADDSFEISLTANPERWESFFQDTARGESINFSISKNDLYSFRLSELKGIYAEAPMII